MNKEEFRTVTNEVVQGIVIVKNDNQKCLDHSRQRRLFPRSKQNGVNHSLNPIKKKNPCCEKLSFRLPQVLFN